LREIINADTMKLSSLKSLGLIGLFCVLIVSAAPAVVVDISPNVVANGQTIKVNVQGLHDGSNVEMDLLSAADVTSTNFQFVVDNLVFPINLDEAVYTLENQHTVNNHLFISNTIPDIGTIEINRNGISTLGSWFTTIQGEGRDDINGTFNTISASGTVAKGTTTQVLSHMNWKGIKKASEDQIPNQVNGGPDDFTIPFAVNGFVNGGTVAITITVNGTKVVSQTITIEKISQTDNDQPVVSTAGLNFAQNSQIPFQTGSNGQTYQNSNELIAKLNQMNPRTFGLY
jgi:hypothetical protein